MFVYRMEAYFACPFTRLGREGDPKTDMKFNRVQFATAEGADRRREAFAAKVRDSLKVEPDYPIEVRIIPIEVIED